MTCPLGTRPALVLAAAALLGLAGCSAATAQPGPSAHARPAASATPSSGPVSSSTGALSSGATPSGCSGATRVSTAAALAAALAAARPGSSIQLAPGTYHGDFSATRSGTPAAPITLCGSRSAVIQGESISHGYALYLDRASWWRLEGFSVAGGQKGVVTDGATHDLISGLYVHGTGEEAIHLRSFSSYNVVEGNVVRDTGLHTHFYGEGIYIGSAHSNWCRYTKCRPDASNDNVVEHNNIAGTTAENIDLKEGTTGGRVIDNVFNGTGMVSSAATAWVNVKGNHWEILGNTGADSIDDGFQVHQVYPGWGIGNVFRDNRAAIDDHGLAIYVQNDRLQTIVACSNVVSGGGSRLSNLTCSQ